MGVWDNESDIRKAVADSSTRGEVIQRLGMNPKGSITRKKLNYAIERFGINTDHLNKRAFDWNEEHLTLLIKESLSVSEVLHKLGMFSGSGNYTTFQKYVELYSISTAHFNPVQAGHRKKAETKHRVIPLQEILAGQHPTYRTILLKKRLLREGLKENRCEVCGLTDWQGNTITLELDHINGVRNDHRWENIRLLCPNCHSQTPTYKGRNIGALA